MRSPLVTCVVPCFNGERYLDESLRSIVEQTHRELEIVVVDDGSTDGSAAVVRRWGAAVRYHHQENRGPGAACNQGLAGGAGELVLILNSDIVARPGAIGRLADHLGSNPGYVAAGARLVDPGTDDVQVGHAVRPG